MDTRPSILLIHGSCHGSWCWQRLTPLLEDGGYDVHTIDLPGRHPSPAWGWRLRLKDQAEAIAAKAAAMSGPIIALAHSASGIAMSAATELEPTLFKRLIYLSAYLPADGDRLITLGGRDKASRVGGATRTSLLQGFISIKPEASGPVFYGDCSEEQVAWASKLLVKEPLRPAFDKIILTDRFATIPRSYIRCTRDRVVSSAFQDEMIGAQRCEKVASLESSHSPFLSMPDQLADAIDAVM